MKLLSFWAKRPPKNIRFEFYKDHRKEWRWRYAKYLTLKRDWEIIAVASEGYKNRLDCEKALKSLVKAAGGSWARVRQRIESK